MSCASWKEGDTLGGHSRVMDKSLSANLQRAGMHTLSPRQLFGRDQRGDSSTFYGYYPILSRILCGLTSPYLLGRNSKQIIFSSFNMYSADRVFEGNIIVGIGRSSLIRESRVTPKVYKYLDFGHGRASSHRRKINIVC